MEQIKKAPVGLGMFGAPLCKGTGSSRPPGGAPRYDKKLNNIARHGPLQTFRCASFYARTALASSRALPESVPQRRRLVEPGVIA
jgi:hypothetical protein